MKAMLVFVVVWALIMTWMALSGVFVIEMHECGKLCGGGINVESWNPGQCKCVVPYWLKAPEMPKDRYFPDSPHHFDQAPSHRI